MSERKKIPTPIKLKLFAESAGHCQRPDCLQTLFPLEMGGYKHIAEMAHVIPHGLSGPRHEERPLEEYEADSFENLILLCPTCHSLIDKAPESFGRAMLLSWKTNHLFALSHKQGNRVYDDRIHARSAVVTAMNENKAIWELFAPSDGSLFEYDPESEVSVTWVQRMRSVILPNHLRIQAIIKLNQHLMTLDEQEVFAKYKEHVRGLSERHICGVSGGAILYPKEMDGIFK